jgi:hypothetical protein
VLGYKVKKSHALFLEFFIGSGFFIPSGVKNNPCAKKGGEGKAPLFCHRPHHGLGLWSVLKTLREGIYFKIPELGKRRANRPCLQTLRVQLLF